jgi:hypothetical protein
MFVFPLASNTVVTCLDAHVVYESLTAKCRSHENIVGLCLLDLVHLLNLQ